jgi:hypothetical protein
VDEIVGTSLLLGGNCGVGEKVVFALDEEHGDLVKMFLLVSSLPTVKGDVHGNTLLCERGTDVDPVTASDFCTGKSDSTRDESSKIRAVAFGSEALFRVNLLGLGKSRREGANFPCCTGELDKPLSGPLNKLVGVGLRRNSAKMS